MAPSPRLVPLLLPWVALWAQREQSRALQLGHPLSPEAQKDASLVGVSQPQRIRVLVVPQIQIPRSAFLRQLGERWGYTSQTTTGLSLGYGIHLRADCSHDRELLIHECVHTAQFERLGSLREFLRIYLTDCLVHGYFTSPMEQEARTTAAARVQEIRTDNDAADAC